MEHDKPNCSKFFLNSIIENDYYLNKYFKNSSLYIVACKIASSLNSNTFTNLEGFIICKTLKFFKLKLKFFLIKPLKVNLIFLDIEINLYRINSIIDDILNTGHYGMVEDKYRVFFAFVSALCAKLEFLKGNYFVSQFSIKTFF